MPIRQVPNTDLHYYLINYDDRGQERSAQDGSRLSQVVIQELAAQPYTDVFVMSHGWLGDIPGAIDQYDRWTANLMSCAADITQLTQQRPGFRPLLVGLHWPSLPWGDEDTGGSFAVDATADAANAIESAVDDYAQRLGDTPAIRQHLKTILTAYATVDSPESLPQDVRAAYQALDRALSLGHAGLSAAPGDDREGFDAEAIFQEARVQEEEDMLSFSNFSFSDLLAPLRMLSFWKMKGRARELGESGANALLRLLQQTAAGRDVRFHLMGHSFGCIVVTAMAAGPPASAAAQAPVHSLILVQGALSLWAYCVDIPRDPGKPGYFRPLIANRRVVGPIVVTRSEHDRAVGWFYPLGAGLVRQDSFADADELPKYGAVGAWGIQGLAATAEGMTMKGVGEPYGFQKGKVYNLESSSVIKQMSGASGAHSDIVHPEVAHAWWQAVLCL